MLSWNEFSFLLDDPD